MIERELDSMPGGKRDDPNYSQVSGYIPRELAKKFRVVCAEKEISQSEAIEQALAQWIEQQTQEN